MLLEVVWYMFTDISEKFTAFTIILLKEAVSSSETQINIYQTPQCSILEGSHFHTCHSENLRSH